MKITDYFNKSERSDDKREDEQKQKDKRYMSYISKFQADSIISLSDFNYIMSFTKKESGLTTINRINLINQIIKTKISDDEYKSYVSTYNDIYGKINELLKCHDSMFKHISIYVNNITFSNDQKEAINQIINFLYDEKSKSFGLYGYAGSGKTTLITSLINYLTSLTYIRKVAFTAPTNKAVNVMKSKYMAGGYPNNNVQFTTVHKLLNYRNDYTSKGVRTFIKRGKSNIWMYDLVVIDECSMISSQIVADIFNEIKDPQKLYSGKNFIKTPKILFVGDPAQLPPVNEISSAIFKKKIRSITMTDILRNDNENVIGICNEVRRWVINKDAPKIGLYKGGKVRLYKCKDGKKLNTMWFKECIKHFKHDNGYSNIVLTWTNRQTDTYNTEIRKKMLNKEKLDRFEINDILILTNYYNLKEEENSKKFYTSEQIKVVNIEHVKRASERFVEDFKLKRIKNMPYIKDKISKCITSINKSTKNQYDVWKLSVVHLKNSRDMMHTDDTYTVYVIKKSAESALLLDKEIATKKIKSLKFDFKVVLKDQFTTLENRVIKPLWKQLNERYVDPFAKVGISTSITVHRSQGSTYHNVFVDADDIFKNRNENEAKRCIYTALTRTSNEVHILI